jgi:hypothetical protein
MADEAFRYDDVRRALGGAAIRHVLTRGNGARLAFFWVLGAGLLLTVLAQPLLAAVYSAACAALLVPVIREGLTDPTVRRQLIDRLLAERFPVDRVTDEQLRGRLARSVVALGEMAARIEEAERRGKPADALQSVFTDAAGLLDLQLESAIQAEQLERVLAFVGSSNGSLAGASRNTEDRRLRDENVRAVAEEAGAARQMVDTIGERLETMLLQSFQIERETIDLVRAREAARESHEAVKRLQDVVDARRAAARRLAGILSPEEERYAGDRG